MLQFSSNIRTVIIKSNKIAVKYALVAVFFWSTVASAFKISLEYLSVKELVMYASLSSLFILFCVLLIQKKLHFVLPHLKTNFKTTLIMGFINPFIYYLVLFQAYNLLKAQEAQAINYTWALMLSILSVIFLKQKLTLTDIVSSIICYFGVLIIATQGEPFSMNFSNLEGLALALFSTVLWAFYWIFNTKVKGDAIVALFCNFLLASPMIILYVFFTDGFTLPSLKGVLGAMYIGFFEMGITFVFWLKAMQSAQNTSKIANLIFISPFISLIFISVLLNESIFISTLIGLCFIIFGLILQKLNKN